MEIEEFKQNADVDKLIAKILEQEKQIQALKHRLEFLYTFNDSLMRSLEKARSKDDVYIP